MEKGVRNFGMDLFGAKLSLQAKIEYQLWFCKFKT